MTLVLTLAWIVTFTALQTPAAPVPGPEYTLLAQDAGTWDAVVEMPTEPGKPPMKSTGVSVNTLGCGGRCLVTEFKADMAGTPFQGHGIATWDPKKKVYTSVWIDSMSAGMSRGESTYDAAAKKWTGTIEGPDPTGAMAKTRTVTESPNDTTRVFTMYAPGPDGKEMQGLKITYTRRK